jgi:hypothetical protein
MPGTAGSALAIGGASAIGTAAGSAGGTTITSCPANDTSFYCTFVRWFNMLKMVIFIIALIALIYVLYNAWASRKGSSGRGRGRAK